MGLDMYLELVIYDWKNECVEEFKRIKIISDIPEHMRLNKVTIEAMYWRKENHIHEWFVRNVQGGEDDCDRYYVCNEQLEDLHRDACNVLRWECLAEALLPTQSGFFFGGTEYDEYYFDSLRDIKELLPEIIALKGDKYYRSSW